MIDSLYLTTTGNIKESSLKKMAEQKNFRTFHERSADYTCYEFRLGSDPNMPFIKYTRQTEKLKIFIPSCPHMLFGSSLKPMNEGDAPVFFDKLTSLMTEELAIDFHDVPEQWQVNKFDAYHDFRLGDQVKSYLTALSQVSISGYKRTNINTETIAWSNGTREIKVYDKHQCCIDKGKPELDLELSKGVARLEVSLSAKDLRSRFKEKVVTADRIFDEANINSHLQTCLSKLKVEELQLNTKREVLDLLEKRHGTVMAYRLLGYIEALLDGKKAKFPGSTRAHYDKMLKEAGVAPTFADRQLPPLTLPS